MNIFCPFILIDIENCISINYSFISENKLNFNSLLVNIAKDIRNSYLTKLKSEWGYRTRPNNQ